MPSLKTWLNEPFGGAPHPEPRPSWMPERPTRLCILAALIAMNGGGMQPEPAPRQYAQGGPYGKMGLTKDEAVALANLGAFVSGCLYVTGNAETEEFKSLIEAEHRRVVGVFEREQAPRIILAKN